MNKSRHKSRSGTTMVESALMLSFFMLFMMGIFEYSRYIMILQVSTNAAAAGARYAAVNTTQPTNFDTVDNGTSTNISQTVINNMGGISGLINSFAVTVFPVDPVAMYSDPPVIQALSGYTSWNQNTFPQLIGVQITGNYVPILPGFVFFYSGSNKNVPIKIIACAGCES